MAIMDTRAAMVRLGFLDAQTTVEESGLETAQEFMQTEGQTFSAYWYGYRNGFKVAEIKVRNA